MNDLSARKKFERMIHRGEERVDLAEAALTMAQEEYPLLDPAPYLRQLDAWAARVRHRLPPRSAPVERLEAVNRVLFQEENFTGNEEDYYDPHNSFLNEVMDRRTGIPITLSVVYLEVARRAGLPLVGVGLPGHFIVRYPAPGRFYGVDPFHGGRFLTESDCREKVQRIYGGRMAFRLDYLKPVGSFAILTRMLYNLKNIYVESKSHAKALAVVDKLILLNPQAWNELRDRAILWYQLKHFRNALTDLEAYLRRVPSPPDRKDLLRLAEDIGRRLKHKG
jgi:regulator of sirC expression with transglutaminase-like and TPR domain